MFRSLSLATALILIAEAASADVMATATGKLNVRSGPSTHFKVVGTISANGPATVSGCIKGSKWCSVMAGTVKGWADAQYLTTTNTAGAKVIVGDQIAALGLPTVTYTAPAPASGKPAAPAAPKAGGNTSAGGASAY